MSLKVLIVDDDDIVVFIHSLIVKDSGLTNAPDIFKNGKTAYDFIFEQQDENNQYLVFLDLNMPVMDGWQFLDLVEKLSCSIYVVIVSSSINPIDLQRSRLYPNVKQFVEKPLSLDVCKKIKCEIKIFNS